MADDVGKRFAARASSEQCVECLLKSVRLGLVRVGDVAFGRPSEDVFREQARVEIGFVRWNAGLAQLPSSGSDASVNGAKGPPW